MLSANATSALCHLRRPGVLQSPRFHPYGDSEVRARQLEIDRLATTSMLSLPDVDSATLPYCKMYMLRVLDERRIMMISVKRDWTYEDLVR